MHGWSAVEGLASQLGQAMCKLLASAAKWRPEVASDFRALARGAWVERVSGVLKTPGTVAGLTPEVVVEVLQKAGHDPAQADEAAAFIPRMTRAKLTLRGFDVQPSQAAEPVFVQLPPYAAAMSLLEEGRRAKSEGRLYEAIELAFRATKLAPEEASAHFFLAGWLEEGSPGAGTSWTMTRGGVGGPGTFERITGVQWEGVLRGW